MFEPLVREMTPLERLRSRVSIWLSRARRKLPYLVWYGDELDVGVTFREAKLPEFVISPDGRGVNAARRYLDKGHLAQIERALGEIGIGFDKGGGPGGRDWEWDFSLSGPISVRFRSRATRPERRT